MRMTSSDFSLRLWAFSVLRARIWKATCLSGITIAGTNAAFSFSRTCRRWFPLGVQYPPSARTATTGSTKRSIFLITFSSRSACAFERSRW